MLGLSTYNTGKPRITAAVYSQQELDDFLRIIPTDTTYILVIRSRNDIPLEFIFPRNLTNVVSIFLSNTNVSKLVTRGNKFELTIESSVINCNLHVYNSLNILNCSFNNQQTRIKASNQIRINIATFTKSNSLLCVHGRDMKTELSIDNTNADDYVSVYIENMGSAYIGSENNINCLTTRNVSYFASATPHIFITGNRPTTVLANNSQGSNIVNVSNTQLKIRLNNLNMNILSEVGFEWTSASLYIEDGAKESVVHFPCGDKWFNQSYFLSICKIITDYNYIMFTKEQCECIITNEEWIRDMFRQFKLSLKFEPVDVALRLAHCFLFHQLPSDYARKIIFIARECGIHPVIWAYQYNPFTTIDGKNADSMSQHERIMAPYLRQILKQLPDMVFSLTNNVVLKVNPDDTYELNPNLEIVSTTQLAMCAQYITEKTTIVYNGYYVLPFVFNKTNKRLVDIVFKWAVDEKYSEACSMCVHYIYTQWPIEKNNECIDVVRLNKAALLVSSYPFRPLLESVFWANMLTPEAMLNLGLIEYVANDSIPYENKINLIRKVSQFVESTNYKEPIGFASRIFDSINDEDIIPSLKLFLFHIANAHGYQQPSQGLIKTMKKYHKEVADIVKEYPHLIHSLSDFIIRCYNRDIYNGNKLDASMELLQIYNQYLIMPRSKCSKWNSVLMMMAEMRIGDYTYNSLQQQYKIDNLRELDDFLFDNEMHRDKEMVKCISIVGETINNEGRPREIWMSAKDSTIVTHYRNPIYFNSIFNLELVYAEDTCIIMEITQNSTSSPSLLGYNDDVKDPAYIVAKDMETIQQINTSLDADYNSINRVSEALFNRLLSILLIELYNNMEKYKIKKIAIATKNHNPLNLLYVESDFDAEITEIPEWFKSVVKLERITMKRSEHRYVKGDVWILEK